MAVWRQGGAEPDQEALLALLTDARKLEREELVALLVDAAQGIEALVGGKGQVAGCRKVARDAGGGRGRGDAGRSALAAAGGLLLLAFSSAR